jgi:hypothetical protein
MNTDTLEALVCGQDWIKGEDGLFRFDEIDDNEDDVVTLSD